MKAVSGFWPNWKKCLNSPQRTDACFYRLGTRNESRGITSSVHTPTFDIEEKALQTGMGLMAWLAVSDLKRK